MTYKVAYTFSCDGPACKATATQKAYGGRLPDGWMALFTDQISWELDYAIPNGYTHHTTETAHFCSKGCLLAWSATTAKSPC